MYTEESSFGKKIIQGNNPYNLLSEDFSFRVVAKKYCPAALQNLKFYHLGVAGMVQCLECLPPTDVAQARFQPSAICGLSLLLVLSLL